MPGDMPAGTCTCTICILIKEGGGVGGSVCEEGLVLNVQERCEDVAKSKGQNIVSHSRGGWKMLFWRDARHGTGVVAPEDSPPLLPRL